MTTKQLFNNQGFSNITGVLIASLLSSIYFVGEQAKEHVIARERAKRENVRMLNDYLIRSDAFRAALVSSGANFKDGNFAPMTLPIAPPSNMKQIEGINLRMTEVNRLNDTTVSANIQMEMSSRQGDKIYPLVATVHHDKDSGNPVAANINGSLNELQAGCEGSGGQYQVDGTCLVGRKILATNTDYSEFMLDMNYVGTIDSFKVEAMRLFATNAALTVTEIVDAIRSDAAISEATRTLLAEKKDKLLGQYNNAMYVAQLTDDLKMGRQQSLVDIAGYQYSLLTQQNDPEPIRFHFDGSTKDFVLDPISRDTLDAHSAFRSTDSWDGNGRISLLADLPDKDSHSTNYSGRDVSAAH